MCSCDLRDSPQISRLSTFFTAQQEGQLAVLGAMAQLAGHPQLAQSIVLPQLEPWRHVILHTMGI